jgi:hypothetical protein
MVAAQTASISDSLESAKDFRARRATKETL